MNRLPAALWLICWPPAAALCGYLQFLQDGKPHAFDLAEVFIWAAVAFLIWPTPAEVGRKGEDA